MRNVGDTAGVHSGLGLSERDRKLDVAFVPATDLPYLVSLRLHYWKRMTFGRSWMVLAPAEWHVLGSRGRKRVAALEIATRDALAGSVPVRLGLIGAVRTRTSCRRRGLGRYLVQRATSHIRVALRCDFALLLCDEPTSAFYARCGFVRVPDQLVFDQPGGRVVSDFVVMVAPCRSTDFPPGRLDLCGLPF